MRYFLVLLLGIVILNSAKANQTVRQQLLWWNGTIKLKLAPEWELAGETEYRHFIDPRSRHQISNTLSVSYQLNRAWQLGIGFNYFTQSPNDPETVNKLIRPEQRPLQYVLHKQQYAKWGLTQRLQLEQRFTHRFSGDQLKPGYNFNVRYRYKLGASVPLQKRSKQTAKVHLVLAVEILLQSGGAVKQQIFDQLRSIVAFNYKANNTLSFTAGYLNWYQQTAATTFDRHILTFQMLISLSTKKAK